MNWLTKLFKKEKTPVYDFFLRMEDEIRESKPDYVKKLAKDLELQLYLKMSGDGKKDWVIAVIKVEIENRNVYQKYDSGRQKGSLEEMAQECICNIEKSWGLDYFRRTAVNIIGENKGGDI